MMWWGGHVRFCFFAFALAVDTQTQTLTFARKDTCKYMHGSVALLNQTKNKLTDDSFHFHNAAEGRVAVILSLRSVCLDSCCSLELTLLLDYLVVFLLRVVCLPVIRNEKEEKDAPSKSTLSVLDLLRLGQSCGRIYHL